MKRLVLAGILTIAATSAGFADALCCYWVAGNRATSKCDIVTSNPVVGGDGNVWFGDGPYKTLEDAKLARSTIRACPKDESSDK
jgi:hypothetical protein